jgi:GT2 family glycosyltransferase
LIAQEPPLAEILVIDNAPSNDATQRLVRDEFPGVRYVRERIPGLDFARNRALSEATQDIVAFLDDDAVAGQGWAAGIEWIFRSNPHVAICTGKVDALSMETEGQKLFEATGGFSKGNNRIEVPGARKRPWHPLIGWSIGLGVGCSLAIRRGVATALGGFDEALDLGLALPGGGDVDMIWRVLKRGYGVVYEPSVQSRHEHRRELGAVVDQIAGHHRATVAMLTKALGEARGMDKGPVLVFLGWRLFKPFARLARRLIGRDPLPARALWRIAMSSWRGLSAYAEARQTASRRKEEFGLATGTASEPSADAGTRAARTETMRGDA